MSDITEPRIPDTITSAAATWLARLCADDVSQAETEQFQSWLTENPRHGQAFDQARQVSDQLGIINNGVAAGDAHLPAELAETLDDCAQLVTGSKTTSRREEKNRQKKGYWALAASLFIAISGGLFWQHYIPEGSRVPAPTLYHTAIGASNTYMLPDGSMMTLNTDTSVLSAITATDRRVQIKQGEVFFDVAKDPERPFTVIVGNGSIRVLGTAFNVRSREDQVQVTVTEGRIAIKPSAVESGDAGPVYEAGQQVVFSDQIDQENSLDSQALKQVLAWRTGKLIFHQASLEEIVKEVQRYMPQKIVIADDDVASLVGGGVFRTENARSLLAAIEQSMPVRVVRRDNVIILVHQ